MSKRFLILQLRPEDETSDSEYAAFLKYCGLAENETTRLRIEKQGIPRDLEINKYHGILVGGSPFDISTPEHEKSVIQKKIELDFRHLFGQIVSRDFPFLGACSGNGLLGSFLGTTISRRYGETVGCVSVNLTEAGKTDPLLHGFPDKINVLLGHKEACDNTPAGATLLISGNTCPVQMFRVGNNVYATQFHPEGDSEGFVLRINTYSNHGYFQPDEKHKLISEVADADTRYAQKILKRFVSHARLQNP